MSNFVQGYATGNNDYNLLISGYQRDGLVLGADVLTSGNAGARIFQDTSNNNTFMDLYAQGANNAMSMRYQNISDPSGQMMSMMQLNQDDFSSTSKYGASVTGRVKASQFAITKADTRLPSKGVSINIDNNNAAYFNVGGSQGAGNGFTFTTYNGSGQATTNLTLNPSGTITAPAYAQQQGETLYYSDTLAAFDVSGNLVRDTQASQIMYELQQRISSIEGDLTGAVPATINQIVKQLNSLNFSSAASKISLVPIFVDAGYTLAAGTPVVQAMAQILFANYSGTDQYVTFVVPNGANPANFNTVGPLLVPAGQEVLQTGNNGTFFFNAQSNSTVTYGTSLNNGAIASPVTVQLNASTGLSGSLPSGFKIYFM